MWWLSIPSNRKRLFRAVSLSVLIVGAGLFIFLTAIYFGLRIFRVILPGVVVNQQDLTFKTVGGAISLLDDTGNQNQPIVLFASQWQTVRSPAELGLRLDATATALAAYHASYEEGFFPGIRRMLGLSDWLYVLPVVTFNETAALEGLQAATVEASVVPLEARFSFNGETLTVIPGVYGRSLDVQATYQTLAADPLTTYLSGYLPVTLSTVIPAIAEVPPEVFAQAQTFVANPVIFRAYDPILDTYDEWPASREALVAAMRLQIQEGRVVLVTDAAPLREELSQFSNTFTPERWLDLGSADAMLATALQSNAPVILTVRYAPTTYTVQPGDTLLVIAWRQGIPLWRILQANPGLDPDHLITGSNLLIPSKTDLIDRPIVFGKRILVDLTDQHMWGFEGDQLVFDYIISTGIDRSPTQPGIFQVRSHVENAYASVWELYMPNFIGIYEAWPGFENGFHGLPSLANGRVLWRGILGRPVSYGCIILDTPASLALYTWAEEGVIVEIRE